MFIQNTRKIKIIRNNVVLIGILILAALLRLWLLQSVPPSPSLDEVSIGYNAFSILRTGRDEYGYFLPLLLRAYDDWRPILYVYLTVPFVRVFGLHAFSVRFPSVLLSLVTIYISYLFVPLLFGKIINVKNQVFDTRWVGLATAFLLAISPWNIYLSRLGHEVNLGLFITVISIYTFLFGLIRQKKLIFTLSGLFFGLSFYTYQSEKVIIPILLVSLLILFRREVKKMGKTNFLAVVILLVISVPAFFVSFSSEGITRFRGTSIFSASQPMYSQAVNDLSLSIKKNDLIGQVIYNRRLVPFRVGISQYFSHFNPKWLFFGTARENHKVPFMGLLYFFEMPFLLLGIILFFFSNVDKKIKMFLVIWFLSSPLPGAITTDAPHAMRSYTFLPTIQIFESIGLLSLLSFLKKNTYRYIAIGGYAFVVLCGLWQFYNNYFIVFPKTQSDSFQSVLFQSMNFLHSQKDSYNNVYISNENNLYQSYMFYLFASGYNPALYQLQGGTRSGGFAERHTIGNITFRPIAWNTEKKQGRIVYIGNKGDFGSGVEFSKSFVYPDGKNGVYIVTYD